VIGEEERAARYVILADEPTQSARWPVTLDK
jgi:hypothetical protein